MNDLLIRASEALHQQDGKAALEWADKALEQDEGCFEAWLIAMQSFQLFLPIDSYDPDNEVSCARYAIRFAPAEEGPGEKAGLCFPAEQGAGGA